MSKHLDRLALRKGPRVYPLSVELRGCANDQIEGASPPMKLGAVQSDRGEAV